MGGDIINMSDDSDDDLEDEDSEDEDSEEESLVSEDEAEELYDEDDHGVDDTKVNLDITAMIAYVSAMTNGRWRNIERFLWKWVNWLPSAQEPFPVPGEDPDWAGGVGAGAARQTRAGPRVQGQAGRKSTSS